MWSFCAEFYAASTLKYPRMESQNFQLRKKTTNKSGTHCVPRINNHFQRYLRFMCYPVVTAPDHFFTKICFTLSWGNKLTWQAKGNMRYVFGGSIYQLSKSRPNEGDQILVTLWRKILEYRAKNYSIWRLEFQLFLIVVLPSPTCSQQLLRLFIFTWSHSSTHRSR
jgi:hypothetical protein